MALAPDPEDAVYDRLRYLWQAAAGQADLFRELGTRLLIRFPGDDAILRNQAQNLGNSKKDVDIRAAIAILDSLARKPPNDPRPIGLKGNIYRVAWINLHRREYGMGAIEWSERYYGLMPSASGREGVLGANDALRKQLGITPRRG